MKRKSFIRHSIFLIALVFVSCSVSSSHPVRDLQTSEPVPEKLIGVWELVEVLGAPPPQALRITLAKDPGGAALITVQSGEKPIELRASAWTLGGATVLSIPSQNEHWLFFAVTVDLDGEHAVLKALDPVVIKRDIQNGVIAGRLHKFDAEDVIELTVSSVDLKVYLERATEAFGSNLAVFKKTAPAS